MPRKAAFAVATTPGGVPITANNWITMKSHDGDATLESNIDTDAEGLFTFTYAMGGSVSAGRILDPGPIYFVATTDSRTRRASSKSGGAVGPNSLLELPTLFAAWGDGVISGQLDNFAVTYDAAGLDIDIAAGCYLMDGQLVTLPTATDLTVSTANATNPRIDRVILRRVRTAGDTEGKVTLMMKDGTAAASPAAPTLTDDANTLEVSLAQIRVNALATTVASVTDERTYVLTAVEKNPTLQGVTRTEPGATALSTTAASIAALAQSIALVSGVWYTITADADLDVDGTSSVAMIAPFIDGTTNLSDYASAPAQTGHVSLRNVHTRRIIGTGAAVSIGVMAKRSSAATVVNYYTGCLTVTCIPES